MTTISDFSTLKEDRFVMFGGKHCMACKMMKPSVLEVEKLLPKISFYYTDGEDSPEEARKWGVTSLPTFLLFKDNTCVKILVGAIPKKKFVEEVISTFE